MTHIETGMASRVGSSEGSSQKSGSSGGGGSRFKTDRALKKKPGSRIMQHDS
jgi:hypothetical protein